MRKNLTSSKIQEADMSKISSNQSNEQTNTTPVVESNFSVEVSAEVQNKIVRLFTYLEKALSLDDVVVRDFRTAIVPPAPWWLVDYPRDLENLYIRSFDTEKETKEEQPRAWIKVQKKSIESAPLLPERLTEWVAEITPLEEPQALEKIDRKVRFDSDKKRVDEFNDFRKNFKQGDKIPPALIDWIVLAPNQLPRVIEVRYIPDHWSDHPELAKLLAGYTESDWEPWAERVKKVYKANLLYDQLYALRLLLKNEGDNYELLLGHGLLTWKNQSVGKIYSPVFLTPLVLDFDAAKRTIEISPDPMFRNFVEITPVSEMDNPAEIDLDTWMGAINTNPFDFWHFESLKSQANTFLNYLSPDSEDRFEEALSAAPTETDNPSIWNAPVIFVRKRTNSLWSKYAEKIRRDIEQNGAKSTEFINDLIGEYDEQDSVHIVDGGEKDQDIALKEAELFFPLPWNDEQKRIAERLEINYGVVVKGPPGTGKSHTIANLIARFLSQGKTVLVTSQTSKALEVLRDKLPENIRSLAVSQLQQTARRDEILQQSIAEISSNLGERHTKFSESKAESVRKELARTREEKAIIANKIRQYILTDSIQKLRINGDETSPMEAARFVSEYSENENLAWFTDSIHFDTDLSFTTDDLKTAYRLLLELNKEDRNLHKFSLPDLTTLPNEDVVLGAFAEFRELNSKSKISEKTFGPSAIKADQGELEKLWEMLSGARKVLVSINDNYEHDIFDACIKSKNEREKWAAILSKIAEKTEFVAQARQKLIGHEVVGSLSLPINDLMDATEELKRKVAGKTKLGTLSKFLLSTNAKKILESYKVDGRSPDSSDRAKILYEQILTEQAEREIRTILNQSFGGLKEKPDLSGENLDVVQLEVLVAGIKRLSSYHDDFLPIQESFQKIKQLSDLSFANHKDIDSAKELIISNVAKFGLSRLDTIFSEWIRLIEDSTRLLDIKTKLIQAIEKRSGTAWKKAIEELAVLLENREHAIRLNEIAEKIKKYAPNLYQDIVGLADQKQKFNCPDNLELAWKIARLESWLDEIHNHTSVDELQGQHERLTKKEFQLNAELVTILAWQRQIDRVSKPQRDALIAWKQAMERFGTGRGRHAHRYLKAAQDAIKTAKDAVPVWIVPLHRAAQMFSDPKAGMFDVVIFDEASQCDVRGITIGYLGKKLLVVGDPEQVSPAGLFEDMERHFELISRFLHDIPHGDRYAINNSFFNIAELRIKNQIMLLEHFRCVPEIIAFSNHHIYEGKLKPLRHPHPKGLLKPALVPILVEGGYQNTNNKVNEPEAKEIVEKIAELVEDPSYQQRPDGHLCTFGIISLLAEDQAKYIKDLLLKHPKIGERAIEERNITCGDAYAFQGDERDVMFLSMVKALDPNNLEDTVMPLTKKDAAQRFNVAATRGRDQVFLYHSIPLNEFRNQNDWRFKILNWYYNPKTEELEAGRAALRSEFDNGRASQFSLDVGNILIDRGYKVIPEYPVIGYRIDLVVQGENARLAVECDGDQYHTLEKWEEDQVRERQLRRAREWEFWRVSGSSFYRHKEKALNSLWKKLDELGIKPIVG